MINRLRKGWLPAAIILSMACASLRAASIDLGTHNVLPNTPGQIVDVMITGNPSAVENIIGFDFFLQIEDGLSGPIITDLQLIAPGTFLENVDLSFGPNPFADDAPTNRKWEDSVVVDADFNSGAGFVTIPDIATILAKVVIDTTGVAPGTYDFLGSVTIGPNTFTSDFTDTQANPLNTLIINGTITIPSNVIPEPASLGLLALVAPALIRRR